MLAILKEKEKVFSTTLRSFQEGSSRNMRFGDKTLASFYRAQISENENCQSDNYKNNKNFPWKTQHFQSIENTENSQNSIPQDEPRVTKLSVCYINVICQLFDFLNVSENGESIDFYPTYKM